MRIGQFKKSGGFLNNVEGIIADYQFTDSFPGADNKKKKGDFNPLYVILSARVDGADEDVTTTMFAGSSDDFEISEDGKTLEPLAEGGSLRTGTPFFKFLESLIEHGFPDSNFEEDVINFEPMIGTRVTYVQVVDEEATKRLGKKKSKDGKKEYARTDLKVSAVLALPAAEAKSGGKSNLKAVAGGKGKAKQEEPESDENEFNDDAVKALVAVIDDAGGEVAKAKLSVKLAQKIGLKNPNREAIRALALSDEFLASEQGWSWNAKKGLASAA